MVLKRTTSDNQHFKDLVTLLDSELAIIDGEDHEFYHQFNGIEMLNQVVVAYINEVPMGCGAMKLVEPNAMEIKRMYTKPERRGSGIAGKILHELEDWASELGMYRCILETGNRQQSAIGLYTKFNYSRIPNYGPYKNVENSVCFEKVL